MGRSRCLLCGSRVNFCNSHQPLFFLLRCPEQRRATWRYGGETGQRQNVGITRWGRADISKSGTSKPFCFWELSHLPCHLSGCNWISHVTIFTLHNLTALIVTGQPLRPMGQAIQDPAPGSVLTPIGEAVALTHWAMHLSDDGAVTSSMNSTHTCIPCPC